MRKRKTAKERKSEIIVETLRLADKVGPDRLTTNMIAKAVGITQPGVFRHFPKKELLWEAVAVRLREDMERTWVEARVDATSSSDALHALTIAHLSLIEKKPALPAILFSRELHSENKRLRSAFFQTMNKFHQEIADTVRCGVSSGEFRSDLDPDDAAFLVIGLIQSLALRWSLSGRRFSLIETAERLFDLQLSGFAAVE